ncbi:YhgN family NAAT transporter [Buchnera aphidicola]|uniref:YhgN family NAAT transporter n=1 Tax=Buchnera aphidicola TaxID=9 RepID=UPI00346423DF
MAEIISTTILLTLIMDPLGNLPIFMSILKKLEPKRQKIIVIREMIIALIIMLLFLFMGEKILNLLDLQTETVSISGGIILFFIALQMIFPSQDIDSYEDSINEEPFLVPLAIPLVAGPSLLATLMLLSHQYLHHISYLVISLFMAWCFTITILLLSSFFLRLFGAKSTNVLERLMGLILIMVSTQMFLDGFRVWLNH